MPRQLLVLRTMVVVILSTTLVCGIAFINKYDTKMMQKMWSGQRN